ncbi:hypothetical protein C5F49_05495 [Nitrosopumilus oxyclinae]|uniref:Uncharacterized protein n=1 Tax=Nitrosopumilus oxyclinae TaxID=1959104 RepID=A0A7D5M5I5_9ARCH|nr:hypothetical protein C5F49_05495 [Nitrosopumilus oxyclinae]
MFEKSEDSYGSKCVCGHFLNGHHHGPIKKTIYSRFSHEFVENRINCRFCECPKFNKKHFWKKNQNYSLKDKS